MILELQGKLNDLSNGATYSGHVAPWRENLTGALVSLGFSPKDSDSAISAMLSRLAANGEDPSMLALGDLLKAALANGKGQRG